MTATAATEPMNERALLRMCNTTLRSIEIRSDRAGAEVGSLARPLDERYTTV